MELCFLAPCRDNDTVTWESRMVSSLARWLLLARKEFCGNSFLGSTWKIIHQPGTAFYRDFFPDGTATAFYGDHSLLSVSTSKLWRSLPLIHPYQQAMEITSSYPSISASYGDHSLLSINISKLWRSLPLIHQYQQASSYPSVPASFLLSIRISKLPLIHQYQQASSYQSVPASYGDHFLICIWNSIMWGFLPVVHLHSLHEQSKGPWEGGLKELLIIKTIGILQERG